MNRDLENMGPRGVNKLLSLLLLILFMIGIILYKVQFQ